MVLLYFSPEWFYRYNILMDFSFAIVALIVSWLAFKAYKKTAQKRIKLFGLSFLLIALSYFIQTIFNLSILYEINKNICLIMKIRSVATFDNLGILTHIILMTTGLAILTYITFKEEKRRLLLLLITIPLTAILLSSNMISTFYLISTILLAFIEIHFITNYQKHKQLNTLLVAIAFLFLIFGNIQFYLSYLQIPYNQQLFYVLGHLLELAAYMLILANFYLVLKNEPKKRTP